MENISYDGTKYILFSKNTFFDKNSESAKTAKSSFIYNFASIYPFLTSDTPNES